jgi:hypothetical protein
VTPFVPKAVPKYCSGDPGISVNAPVLLLTL